MTANWSRRTFLAAAGASAAALAGCGSSTIESALSPSRFISFGDGFSDVGQTGVRYTVNDGSVNIWAEQLASRYTKPLVASSSGGLGYAAGGARVADVAAQIDTFLAGNTFGANDVVLINGGLADIVAEVTAASANTSANIEAAGIALGAQVRRLVNAGAKYVVMVGVYNLAKSPWGQSVTGVDLTVLSNKFNEALLVSVVDLGANVLYVDAAYYFNLVVGTPAAYSMTNVTSAACTTPEATSCTASTIVSGIDYNTWLFADSLYFTPAAHRLFGNHAYAKLGERW